MRRNSNADEIKQLMDHHTFIVSTDRKSLHSQIKSLVLQAQEVALGELNQRRSTLQKLLEHEDKIYEEEFANKVKSRIDEDIQERKNILLKIKEESTKNEQEFLKSKRIQQYMNSCYEIREALRHKEMQDVKQCQLEQMLEKERSQRCKQEVDEYWYKVQQKNVEVADRRQREEVCLKQALVKHNSDTLKVQVAEQEEKREKIRQEKLEEKQKLDVLLEELRIEEFDRKVKGKSAKVFAYRQELFDMMAEKQILKEKEEQESAEMHRHMVSELTRLEAQESAAALEKKKAFQQATIDYIKYVQRMRDLEKQQKRMYDERTQDLYRVDICTKRNILRERQRKARIAEQCYAELRKQICEQQERRLRDEAEQRECKIIENRFVRDEIPREKILEQRQKNREDLDKQIAELKIIREAEEAKFNQDLKRASNDPEFCSELAEQYIKEGIDYLEPHANWRVLLCPNKEYVLKPLADNPNELMGQESNSKRCIEPCGYRMRERPDCSVTDGRGDEQN